MLKISHQLRSLNAKSRLAENIKKAGRETDGWESKGVSQSRVQQVGYVQRPGRETLLGLSNDFCPFGEYRMSEYTVYKMNLMLFFVLY